VIVVALNKAAHKYLQQQFINRTVTKRYFAVLDGVLEQDKGTVNLPLRTDFEDRPRQVVCYQYGKDAETSWEVVGRTDKQTQVNFYPKTGRTHQIRVHAAHKDGLNIPLVGDELYGKPDKRLYLHAETLVIKHPVSHEKMVFQVDPNF
jgi:tRNA pseudouridine32 synthase/23S rRNA pseudouridine746 synthase